MRPDIGVELVLFVVKLMFPAPDAPKPIAVFELVQLYTTPVLIFEESDILAGAPKQKEGLLTVAITGIGLTVIRAVTGVPEHVWLFVTKDGVTLIRP